MGSLIADNVWARRAQYAVAGGIVLFIFANKLFPAPLAILFLGAVLGSLQALLAMGIVLIYRANRFINFAQGDLGALAALLGVLLVAQRKWPLLAGLGVGILGALLLGGLIEFLFIRRFSKAPRLIVTVASIGIAQILGGAQLALPSAFGVDFAPQDFPSPFNFTFNWHPVVFRGSHLLAIIVVVGVAAGLGAFFRYSRVGVAVRGAAEQSERAWLLGIPVSRINVIVWVLAGGMSAVGIFLRAPIVGVPIGQVLGPPILLRALAAAVIGRMESLPVTFAAAVGLGVIEQAVFWDTGRSLITDAVLFAVILLGLLLQRRGAASRIGEEATSSWQASREVRPIPPELRRLPEVVWARFGGALLLAFAAIVVPLFLDASRVNQIGTGLLFAMVALSLIVLTGWSGQISLGQMAFFGFGMAVSGSLVANGWDFFAALAIGSLVGALVALVIGIPALRIRGPFLAVATLGFGLATLSFFLNEEFFGWLVPTERITRPLLFQRFDLESELVYYFFILALLAVTIRTINSLRSSRTGRALVAARDNPRAAQAYGINLTKVRLFGFAVSGFLAALAGGAFIFHQRSFTNNVLSPEFNIRIFSMAVIGGLGSVPGVLMGAAFFAAIDFFVTSARAQLFTSGAALLFILLIFPGGLGQVVYNIRDFLLRKLAAKHDIVVPSLVADIRVEAESSLPDIAAETIPMPAAAADHVHAATTRRRR